MTIPLGTRGRRRPRGQEFRQSPVEAYREGLLGGAWRPPSAFLAECISIAASLQAATLIRPGERRVAAIARIAERARPMLPPATAETGSRHEPRGVPTALAIIRALAECVDHEEGHLPLGAHMRDSLALMYPPETLEGVRILLARANANSIAGQEDLMLARCLPIMRFARRTGSSDLLAQAWSGVRTYAQHRGNIPQAERAARRSLKHAQRANDPRVLAWALMQQGTMAGMREDYPLSVELMWRAYRLSDHDGQRAFILANLGETLYRSGHFRASRAARALVFTYSERAVTLVSLGGYAVSCASLGDIRGVEWAARQALTLTDMRRDSRPAAQGLLGCADACGLAGLSRMADELYARGMAIAERNGYHDLRFRSPPTRKPEVREAPRFDGDAEAARQSIIEMAPDGVSPDMVVVVR